MNVHEIDDDAFLLEVTRAELRLLWGLSYNQESGGSPRLHDQVPEEIAREANEKYGSGSCRNDLP